MFPLRKKKTGKGAIWKYFHPIWLLLLLSTAYCISIQHSQGKKRNEKNHYSTKTTTSIKNRLKKIKFSMVDGWLIVDTNKKPLFLAIFFPPCSFDFMMHFFVRISTLCEKELSDFFTLLCLLLFSIFCLSVLLSFCMFSLFSWEQGNGFWKSVSYPLVQYWLEIYFRNVHYSRHQPVFNLEVLVFTIFHFSTNQTDIDLSAFKDI